MTTIVIYDASTRVEYDSDNDARQALSRHLGRQVTVRQVQAEAVKAARQGNQCYPVVLHGTAARR